MLLNWSFGRNPCCGQFKQVEGESPGAPLLTDHIHSSIKMQVLNNTSLLEAKAGFSEFLMKGNFNPYVL